MKVSISVARRRRNNRLFKEAKGNVMGRKRLLRTVKEVVVRSRCVAYRDRRLRKRDFRALWIVRISAAAGMLGLSYSRFMHGMVLAQIDLNRKMLSEIAFHHPEVFGEIVEQVKAALAKKAPAVAHS